MQGGEESGEYEPFGFSAEGIKPMVSKGGGSGPDFSSTIFGGGGGSGRSSCEFLPAASMSVGRQTVRLS
jgi:hypothetical protein